MRGRRMHVELKDTMKCNTISVGNREGRDWMRNEAFFLSKLKCTRKVLTAPAELLISKVSIHYSVTVSLLNF